MQKNPKAYKTYLIGKLNYIDTTMGNLQDSILND